MMKPKHHNMYTKEHFHKEGVDAANALHRQRAFSRSWINKHLQPKKKENCRKVEEIVQVQDCIPYEERSCYTQQERNCKDVYYKNCTAVIDAYEEEQCFDVKEIFCKLEE